MDAVLPPAVLKVALALVASGLGDSAEPAADERPPHTVPEAATLLKVHESTVYRAIQDGRLGAYSVGAGGRAIRIPAGELDEFRARHMIRKAAS